MLKIDMCHPVNLLVAFYRAINIVINIQIEKSVLKVYMQFVP